MRFDAVIKNAISAAFSEQKDVFLSIPFPDISEILSDGIKTVIILPQLSFSGAIKSYPLLSDCSDRFDINVAAVFADVRLLSDFSFRQKLISGGFFRFVIPFAECAHYGEYGYRSSYAWIGEMKAETDGFIQSVAFFSSGETDYSYFISLFACNDAVVIENNNPVVYSSVKTVDGKNKFRYTAELLGKCPDKKQCVMFNTRNEAVSFYGFLKERGIAALYFDGNTNGKEAEAVCNALSFSTANIIVATKSFIPVSLFYPCDRVIFCGVPFSAAHYCRCGCISGEASPLAVFCEADYIRNKRIITAFSEYSSIENIEEERLRRMNNTEIAQRIAGR